MLHKIHHRVRRHTISLRNAWDGVFWVLRTQPNYQVHVFLSLLVVGLGIYYRIEQYEWLTILVFITIGLSIETINSAFEQTLDCVSLERRDDIRIAKDVAAGAMLIFAVGALVGALLIFVPRFLLI